MIHVYGLTFRVPDYAKRSVDSIINNASEPICFTIADNFDRKGSDEIRDFLKKRVDEGKIERVLLFDTNNIGWSLCEALRQFPPDESEKFFVLTDLDLVVPDGCDWISYIRKAHEQEGCILTGCTLDMSNYYNTPNGGYGGDADGFGIWLLGINRTIYFRNFPPESRNCIDFVLRDNFAKHGKVKKILDVRLYHCAWDLWKDDKEYWDFKVASQGNWCYMQRPEKMEYEVYTKKSMTAL